MAAPVIGRRLRFVPRTGATIDWTHPLSERLAFCFIPTVNDNAELTRGYVATKSAGVDDGRTDFGPARFFPSGTTYYSFASFPDAALTGPASLLCVGRGTLSTATVQYISGKMTNSNFNQPISFYTTGTTFQWVRGGSTLQPNFTWGSYTPNKTTTLIATAPGVTAGAWDGWQDGVYQTQTPSATSQAIGGSGLPLVVGARPADSLTSGWHINILAFWSRRLNHAEAEMLTADPFCFLKV